MYVSGKCGFNMIDKMPTYNYLSLEYQKIKFFAFIYIIIVGTTLC